MTLCGGDSITISTLHSYTMNPRAKLAQLVAALLALGICSPALAKRHPKASEEPTDSASESSSSGGATVAPKSATEKHAAKFSREALGADFRAGRFLLAEGKLREAIHMCANDMCSVGFQSRLHRDLGFLYVTGLRRLNDARKEFAAAWKLDPSVSLTPAMQTPEVKEAFDEAMDQSSSPKARKHKPVEADADGDEETLEPTPLTSKAASDEELESAQSPPGKNGIIPNWITLSIQQDWVYHAKSPSACGPASHYRCFDADKVYRVLDPTQFNGNQISSAGPLPGTVRVLVGFDRVVHPHLSLGVRLGSVISGKAPKLESDQPFVYFHGEARLAFWFGPDVFSRAGLRPYLFLSGGYAEADGKVVVDFKTNVPGDTNTYKLDAWKRSGHTFAGTGLGIQAAFTKSTGPLVEFRYMQFISPNVPVLAAQLGYAIGF